MASAGAIIRGQKSIPPTTWTSGISTNMPKAARWHTRIGKFNFVGGGSPTPTPTASPSATPTATPAGCTWSAGPDMPTALVRAVGVYFPADGNFYTMGGRTSDTAGSDFQHVLQYTPGSNSWTQRAVDIARQPDEQHGLWRVHRLRDAFDLLRGRLCCRGRPQPQRASSSTTRSPTR